jgi:hypothetical protein
MRHEHGVDPQFAPGSGTSQRAGSHAGVAAASSPILQLQSAAGNRAVAGYLQRLTESPARASVQRDELSAAEDAVPLQTPPAAPAAKFSDTVNVSSTDVPITVRNNAFDLVNALQARFGGDGGRTTVAPGSFTPEVDAAGRITAAQLTWSVQVLVPVVRADPDGSISKPEAAAELKACQDLVARIRDHENKHAAIEVAGRANFAITLKGKLEKAIDPALAALGKAVGKKQRALDNQEGMITLNSANVVVVSGKDHPEYEADGAG